MKKFCYIAVVTELEPRRLEEINWILFNLF